MIKHRELLLKEQKYVGIKTMIYFEKHDDIDFFQLHYDALSMDIKDIDNQAHFMALDSDFTKKSFCYTPLVPVNSFDNKVDFTYFTRPASVYYAFKVVQKDCNPNWFKALSKYIKANDLNINQTGYDLEYYSSDYIKRMNQDDFKFREEVFEILLQKEEKIYKENTC